MKRQLSDTARMLGYDEFDYHCQLGAQGGVCAICGNPPGPARRLAIDHDHETNRVRGLLCAKCNMGLGYFRDQARLLVRAAIYLRDSQHGPCPKNESCLGGAIECDDDEPLRYHTMDQLDAEERTQRAADAALVESLLA